MGKAHINFEDHESGRVAVQIQWPGKKGFDKDSQAHQMALEVQKFIDALFERANDPELVKYFTEGAPALEAPPEKELLLAPSGLPLRHLRSC